jgi:outer membrane protein assembly factor BamB
MADGVAYFGTYANEVIAVDIANERVAWRFADPVRQFPYYASAAIVGDLVVVGGRDKAIRALDRRTGAERWAYMTRARVDSSPAVAGNRVVAGSGDGKVYVVDLRSGTLVWDFEGGAGFVASPAIAGGRIVIGDVDGRVYAIGAR